MKLSVQVSRYKLKELPQKAAEVVSGHITQAIFRLGEKYSNIIRNRSEEESWHNVSGNLRSGIGAAVYEKGKLVIATAFETVLNGYTGSAKGKRLVEELAALYTDGYTLALVSSMEYSEKVERLDGRDVLASAETGIGREFENTIKEAMKGAEKELQSLFDNL